MPQTSDSRVVVYGAGGHGKVVAEVVASSGLTVIGFIDDGLAVGTEVLGLRVLGPFDWLHANRATVALGVGSNAARAELLRRLRASHLGFGTFVHASAWVSPSAQLGAGTVVMAGAVVNAEARIGDGVIVNTSAVVEHECVIGECAHLSPAAVLGGGVTVGPQSHLGVGVAVRPFAAIGARCVIGAGSVVLKGVDDDQTVAGVPARPLKK